MVVFASIDFEMCWKLSFCLCINMAMWEWEKLFKLHHPSIEAIPITGDYGPGCQLLTLPGVVAATQKQIRQCRLAKTGQGELKLETSSKVAGELLVRSFLLLHPRLLRSSASTKPAYLK